MNKKLKIFAFMLLTMLGSMKNENIIAQEKNDDFKYFIEQFADIRIMRYRVPGFDSLSLQQKKYIYFLSQSANAGRDIIYDQNCRYNLLVRNCLENIFETYTGDRNTDEFAKFTEYLKRVWFANGIHHHYSSDKFIPGFSKEYFYSLMRNSDKQRFVLSDENNIDNLMELMSTVIFDTAFMPKRVSLNTQEDMIVNSACNFYEDVTEKEAHDFYNNLDAAGGETPVSFGLNSKLVKADSVLKEIVWKKDGMYGPAIEKIIYWLDKAMTVAENDLQKQIIKKLIEYYSSGDLKKFDEYNILWVKDTASQIDFINGFIEVYGDPIGRKASWEAVVNFKDNEATQRATILSANAQWFENNAPIDTRFKKKNVKGISAKVITVAMLGGDCHPSTPIGINLPNSDWIRKDYGSKSVTISNITDAYDKAGRGTGLLEEFSLDTAEVAFIRKYGTLAGQLHTDLHECLGHGSGQTLKGVPSNALKSYYSTLEEARADLYALYYLFDPKLVELGIMPSLDVGKAEYISYIRNGLMTQLIRIESGKDLEEAHMRNRQIIASWCYEHGKADNVIEKIIKDNKTYLRINDFNKLRILFGQLLVEVQRIKSEGDYEAGKALVEQYGVTVDHVLHDEVLERFAKLNLAPYGGFINPEYTPVYEDGKITNVEISYPDDFLKQMLKYSKEYSTLLPSF